MSWGGLAEMWARGGGVYDQARVLAVATSDPTTPREVAKAYVAVATAGRIFNV